nr:SLC13 family permease [Candidatus Kuenenia stuttgartiensis]
MFDFIPVGAAITMCGLFFISIIGWRLTPQRKEQDSAEDLFEISSYLTELIVPEGCKFAGRTLYDLIAAVRNDADVVVIGLVRTGRRQQMPSTYEVIKENDILLVEADSDSLKTLIDVTGLKLAEASGNEDKEKAREGGPNLVEATVAPGSMLAGKTARSLDLRERYGINVLAVARQGRRLRERLGKIRFVTGDILLIQGREESLPSTLNDLGCLPLASRGLRIGKPRNVLLAICIFAVSLALIACKLLPAATALAGGAAAMVLAGLISPGEIYKSIDMSIILLLAAMLPIGHALESTGGSQLIAYKLLAVGRSASPAMTLVILMTATMLLSNLVNNAAAAILAAPIAINLAKGMELSVDPFLMAVAIGSSCAFLTPIGHQSNTLVMAPGGYKFGDYWRMGLPLSVLVVATAVPVILWIWPL